MFSGPTDEADRGCADDSARQPVAQRDPGQAKEPAGRVGSQLHFSRQKDRCDFPGHVPASLCPLQRHVLVILSHQGPTAIIQQEVNNYVLLCVPNGRRKRGKNL